jgi:glutaredoxin 3
MPITTFLKAILLGLTLLTLTMPTDAKVVVYSAPSCTWCQKAKELLDEKKIAYEIIDITKNAAAFKEMQQKCNKGTVPQIFINDKHIGSYMNLLTLSWSGELETLTKGKKD